MSLQLTIDNRLHEVWEQADQLVTAGKSLADIACHAHNFDHDDVHELLDDAELAIGKIRSKAVAVSRLLTEQREADGEPRGRKREETA